MGEIADRKTLVSSEVVMYCYEVSHLFFLFSFILTIQSLASLFIT